MPIYEYQCPECAHRFEKLQKIQDGPITTCPACGQQGVRKLISQTSFILKGSGWYKDHYGLKHGAATAKGAGDTKDSGGAKDSGGGASTAQGANGANKPAATAGAKLGATAGATAGAKPGATAGAMAPSGASTPTKS